MFRWLTAASLAATAAFAATIPNREIDTQRALFRALRSGDCAAATALIHDGASANSADANGTTALMKAALYTDSGCVAGLLKAGADPNAKNSAGATALMWAIHDPAKVRVLLKHGANPNARSAEGRTALLIAARQPGSLPVARMLVAKGADAKAKDAVGATTLILAADSGDLELVRYFAELGVDVNAQADPAYSVPRLGQSQAMLASLPPHFRGVSALMVSAQNECVECVAYLLKHGADPNLKAFGTMDALVQAAQRPNPEITRLLLERGVSVDGRDMRGATPLLLAAASDNVGPAIVRMLLEHGADPSVKDPRYGRTALDWARLRGQTEVTTLLESVIAAKEKK